MRYGARGGVSGEAPPVRVHVCTQEGQVRAWRNRSWEWQDVECGIPGGMGAEALDLLHGDTPMGHTSLTLFTSVPSCSQLFPDSEESGLIKIFGAKSPGSNMVH